VRLLVYSSARGSVQHSAAVRAAVCDSAQGSVRAIGAAVCGSALGTSVWQCARHCVAILRGTVCGNVCAAIYVRQRVRQCGSMRQFERLCAAVRTAAVCDRITIVSGRRIQ
jgi:hypothetical protein